MKNKILLIILTIILIGCCLVGCDVDVERAKQKESCGVTPKITEYGDDYYFYIVDENTQVVYLGCYYGYWYGITVMLNADGTPITADQLNLR